MKKVLFAIVILAAIWAWPEGRAKLVGVLHPVLARLGPVGAKIEDPIKKYSAKTEVASIIRAIERAREEGKGLPDPRTFSRWLHAHPVTERGELDPWGNDFYMTGESRTRVVGSPGPDGVKGNADDIINTATF